MFSSSGGCILLRFYVGLIVYRSMLYLSLRQGKHWFVGNNDIDVILSSSLCSFGGGGGVCVTSSLLLLLSLSIHSTSLPHLQWPPIYDSSLQPIPGLLSSCVPISTLAILFLLFLSLLLAKPLLAHSYLCPAHLILFPTNFLVCFSIIILSQFLCLICWLCTLIVGQCI